MKWYTVIGATTLLMLASCVKLPNDDGDLAQRLNNGPESQTPLEQDRAAVVALLQKNDIDVSMLDALIHVDDVDGEQRIVGLNLDVVNLGEHQISQLPDVVYTLFALRSLKLGGNNLENVSPKISRLTELQELDLSFNQLDGIPSEIGDLNQLSALFVNDNNLRGLPDNLVGLGNLDALNINGNQLCNLSDSMVRWIDQLSGRGWRLSQSCNGLDFPCTGFDNLTLVAPFDGEEFYAGDNIEIFWCYGGLATAGRVNVVAVKEDGSRTILNTDGPLALGEKTFVWASVPVGFVSSSVKLRVENSVDDGVFTEVTVRILPP